MSGAPLTVRPMQDMTHTLACWPNPERGLKALLETFALKHSVRSRVYDGRDATDWNLRREYDRFLAGGSADTEKSADLLIRSLDALLQELTGRGLDEMPEFGASLQNLEDRYGALRTVPLHWASQTAVDWFVLSRLVVPWLASLAAGYSCHGMPVDAGMPGGRFWFLPAKVNGRIVYPLNKFLSWWCDIAGFKHRSELLDRIQDLDPGISRTRLASEMDEWVSAKHALPEFTRIVALATLAEKLGRAADCDVLDEPGPLDERMARCVAFASKRGLSAKAWSLEIATPLQVIDEILTAVSAGRQPKVSDELGERFVGYVRRRWAKPTKTEVRNRLLIARGVQKLFTVWQERFGDEKALGLCAIFHRAHNVVITLLTAERGQHQKLIQTILSSPGGAALTGILLAPGSAEFLDHAISFVIGSPERYEQDPVPVIDDDEEGNALYLLRQMLMDIVDCSRDLYLMPPPVPKSLDQLSREQVKAYGATVERLFDVLAAKDNTARMWAAYQSLPTDTPASAIHVRMASRIVDTIAGLDSDRVWHPRYAEALAKAQSPDYPARLRMKGYMLESWWLTALHRPKLPGDAARLEELFRIIGKIDQELNGSIHYELAWRRGRYLVQSGRAKEAVQCYEKILKHGRSNINCDALEFANEALAVSHAAGAHGRFGTILRHVRKHAPAYANASDEWMKRMAKAAYDDNFENSFPSRGP